MSPLQFPDFLRALDKGRVVGELAERLAELVQAIKETGKAGALTIKIDLGAP